LRGKSLCEQECGQGQKIKKLRGMHCKNYRGTFLLN
jgi:hypothetical protein